MFRLLNHVLRRQFPSWDKPSQAAFVLGIVMLVLVLLILTQLPQESRAPALIAAGAVIFTLEIVVLWANRGMVTAYKLAQRAFLQGDYATAQRELEPLRSAGKADVQALTLLGNTYRQLGRLEDSEVILREALAIAPNHHFPLYGFGRTLLIKGDYANAAAIFESALKAGAPSAIRADLGEALYRSGDQSGAIMALQQVAPQIQDDPQRRLMVNYLLYRLGEHSSPETATIYGGITYWADLAERFQHTPYGVSLRQDVAELQPHIGAD